MEWDRGEELTWERLLGLDGSLVFLEHVFWVASLNALFILVFGMTNYICSHFNLFETITHIIIPYLLFQHSVRITLGILQSLALR